MKTILKVENLFTYFESPWGMVKAVDGVGFSIEDKETFCLIGESGSGKSVTALSIIGLTGGRPGIVNGKIYFDEKNLLEGLDKYCKKGNNNGKNYFIKDIKSWNNVHKKNLENVRGKKISMIFQDPVGSLDPVFTVGSQLKQTIYGNKITDNKKEAHQLAVKMLEKVKLPYPEKTMSLYPFQLSGGMAQRVMISLALLTNPKLLIADEPTTALDSTVQIKILNLLSELKEEFDMSILLITHDIGIGIKYSDKIAVMYAGRIVETGNPENFYPALNNHPYTRALFESKTGKGEFVEKNNKLNKAAAPDPAGLLQGCKFFPRCKFANTFADGGKKCMEKEPEFFKVAKNHFVKCWKYER